MKQSRKSPRHPFVFQPEENEENLKPFKSMAIVRRGRKKIVLTLTAAHVRRAIERQGVGNTQKCAMAMCAKTHKDAFPHRVEGFIDWTYRRAYVVSKCSKQNGLPSECYVYGHLDEIAQLNDTLGGQKKLLAELERDGDRIITLYPIPPYKPYKGPIRKGAYTGKRTKIHSRGAKRRFAVAQLGGVSGA